MITLRLLQLLLVIHLSGLVLMAGTSVVSFAAFRNLSHSLNGNKDSFAFYAKKMFGLAGLLALGGILMVLSGAGLLILTRAYGQFWFQVKMGLVVALILNGFLFGLPQEQKIKKMLDAPGDQIGFEVQRPVGKLRTFYAIQLFLYFSVVVLAVTKPG